jgi:hypothetical protein
MKKSVPFTTVIAAIVIIMLSSYTYATETNQKSSHSDRNISSFKNVSVDTLPRRAQAVDGDGNPLPPGTRWDAVKKKIIVRRTGKIYVAPKQSGTEVANVEEKTNSKLHATKSKTKGLEDEDTKTNVIEVKDIK